MLRAIFVLAAIGVGLRYSARGPFFVLLFYLWLGYFRPEQWVWGSWMSTFNLSFFVGLFLVASTLLSAERLRGGLGSWLFFAFLGQTLLSMLLSSVIIWPVWEKFAQTITVSYLIFVLVTNEQRLRLTIWIIALSLGFEGAKQGWAQFFLNPGGLNDNTMPMLGDNNGVAIGMLMIVPLLTALADTASGRVERYVERFMAVGVTYRALATYSRGGFLACAALGGHVVMRSKNKFTSALAIIIVIALIAPALPDAFWDRMRTIRAATEDGAALTDSSVTRQHFWRVALVMVQDNPFAGVGFNAYNAYYARYDFSHGQFGVNRSVHSVWFGLLAELGYTGFAIFVVLLALTVLRGRRARQLAKNHPEFASLARYATAIEAGLVVFAVGGSFLPFQYNEMVWHFLGLSMVIDRLTREGAAKALTT